MKNKAIIYCSILLLSLGSCGDFLEPKSNSEYVPKDANSLNEVLLAEGYPLMGDAYYLYMFMGLLDDDIDGAPYVSVKADPSKVEKILNFFSWQPDMMEKIVDYESLGSPVWANFYRKILGTNAVLDRIGDVSGTENEINNVTAQAYALRGYYYFYLVNIWGEPYSSNKNGLGVPLRTSSVMLTTPLPRNTVEEVYTQVISDLQNAEKAYEKLPKNLQWRQNYRTSLPMVQLLLSRVYLYMENWEESARYANKVIKEWSFRLQSLNVTYDPNTVTGANALIYNQNFNFVNPANSETIWSYGAPRDVFSLIGEKGGVAGADGSVTSASRRGIFKASDGLMACFDESPEDLRKERYCLKEKNSTEYRQPFGKVQVNADFTAYVMLDQCGRAFRLSEAYLNLAEAKAMIFKNKGDHVARTEALRALNDLRVYRFKVGMSAVDEAKVNSPDNLVTFARNERRRELCGEDFRWFDLRRYGMPEIRHTWYDEESSPVTWTLKQNDPAYRLPIPTSIMENNSALVQNPTWEKRNAQ